MSVNLSDEKKQSCEEPLFTVGVAAGPSVQLLGCHCGV